MKELICNVNGSNILPGNAIGEWSGDFTYDSNSYQAQWSYDSTFAIDNRYPASYMIDGNNTTLSRGRDWDQQSGNQHIMLQR